MGATRAAYMFLLLYLSVDYRAYGELLLFSLPAVLSLLLLLFSKAIDI